MSYIIGKSLARDLDLVLVNCVQAAFVFMTIISEHSVIYLNTEWLFHDLLIIFMILIHGHLVFMVE